MILPINVDFVNSREGVKGLAPCKNSNNSIHINANMGNGGTVGISSFAPK